MASSPSDSQWKCLVWGSHRAAGQLCPGWSCPSASPALRSQAPAALTLEAQPNTPPARERATLTQRVTFSVTEPELEQFLLSIRLAPPMAAWHHGTSVKCQRLLPALQPLGRPGILPIPMSQNQKVTFLKKSLQCTKKCLKRTYEKPAARTTFNIPSQLWGQGQRGTCGMPWGLGHGVQEEDPATGEEVQALGSRGPGTVRSPGGGRGLTRQGACSHHPSLITKFICEPGDMVLWLQFYKVHLWVK